MNIKETNTNMTTIQKVNQIQDDKPKRNMEQSKNNQNPPHPQQISKEELQITVNTLNEFLKPARHNLQFELHEDLEKYFVTVVNPETDEIIREIPPKKMLDMYAKMAEYMGFLVDKKV